MKTLKRYLSGTLLGMLLCVLLSTTAFADMGPKFSVEIRVDGLGEQRCYATLLSGERSTGPASVWDGSSEPEDYELGLESGGRREEAAAAFYAFGNYEDPDGYCFLARVFPLETGSLVWGYYPPDSFKLLLYFPESGELLAGEKLERYAFSSAYRVALNPDGSLGEFEKTNGPLRQIPSFLLRVAVSILIELAMALPFGFLTRYSVPLLIRTNLWTQLGLNLALAIYSHSHGASGFFFTAAYLTAELCVFIAEALVYQNRLSELAPEKEGTPHPVLYAFAANAASFGLGIWLASLLPFSF